MHELVEEKVAVSLNSHMGGGVGRVGPDLE